MSDLVLTRFDGDVAEIRFNRPKALNALDLALAEAFRDAVLSVTDTGAARAILLTAEGRGFVAGGDVADFGANPDRAPDRLGDLLDALHPAILALHGTDAPVIAAVRGVAAGAGLSLMMGADLVVLDEGAKLLLAYDRIGGVPDCGGSWAMARRLPRGVAMELMVLGRPMDAAEAKALGLATEVAPDAEVEPRAREIAARVAAGPTRAYGAFRRLMDGAAQADLAAQLEAEKGAFTALAGTEDFRAGVQAFLTKGTPRFTGR
jgi:2-(1,2-epoxy-1,2-dihydrophenyl)acetyl-CoA isomerase